MAKWQDDTIFYVEETQNRKKRGKQYKRNQLK
jgi:hypothetical protein